MSDWLAVPQRVREIVEQRLGDVSLTQVHPGQGSDLACTLRTVKGPVFLKAVNMLGARAEVRRIEVRVQEYLPASAPRMQWHTEEDSWLVMCFEHVDARHAVLSPGSGDLRLIAIALTALSEVDKPGLPVLPIEKRWAPFAPDSALEHLRGQTLIHTDLAAGNVLIGERVRIVDWAWPSLGASWLDTALMIPRLIQVGHTPAEAERWAAEVPAWGDAEPESIDACVVTLLGFAELMSMPELSRSVQTWQRHRTQV